MTFKEWRRAALRFGLVEGDHIFDPGAFQGVEIIRVTFGGFESGKSLFSLNYFCLMQMKNSISKCTAIPSFSSGGILHCVVFELDEAGAAARCLVTVARRVGNIPMFNAGGVDSDVVASGGCKMFCGNNGDLVANAPVIETKVLELDECDENFDGAEELRVENGVEYLVCDNEWLKNYWGGDPMELPIFLDSEIYVSIREASMSTFAGTWLDLSDVSKRKAVSMFLQVLPHKVLDHELDEFGNTDIIGDGCNLDEGINWIATVTALCEVIWAASREFEEVVLHIEPFHSLYFGKSREELGDQITIEAANVDAKRIVTGTSYGVNFFKIHVLLQFFVSTREVISLLRHILGRASVAVENDITQGTIHMIDRLKVQGLVYWSTDIDAHSSWESVNILMQHFPNLRLEDKAISIGGGVDRDSKSPTLQRSLRHWRSTTTPRPPRYMDESPKKIYAYL